MQTNSRRSESDRDRKILLTRRPARCRDLLRRLESAGLQAEARPAICFEDSRDPEAVQRAVLQVDDFSWVVFSSPEGVSRWLKAAGTRPNRIAAVGPATKAALEKNGWSVDRLSHSVGAQALVDTFPDLTVQDEQRILLVRPEEGRPELPLGLRQKKYHVVEVPFYRTVASSEAGAIASDLSAKKYTDVLFASPSAVHAIFEQAADTDILQASLATTDLVAIGTTTAEALRIESLSVVVAASPSAEDIYRALVLPSRLPEE